MMVSGSLLAQQVTNPPPAAPIETPAAAPMTTNAVAPAAATAASTNTPSAKPARKKTNGAKKAAKKPAHKQAAAELKTVPLVAGPAVVEANHVNVRGQPRLQSEVVGRLDKDQQVTVLQEIIRNDSGPSEPSAWAKILLPPNVHVWVNTAFIDATNKTVLPRRLNFRAGAGENYSILGRLERGDSVKTLGAKGEWTEIEAPTNAYAFVAAQYLKQEPAGTVPPTVASTTPEASTPTPSPTPVPESPSLAEAPTGAPSTMTPPAPAETPATVNAPLGTNAVAETSSSTNEPAPAVAAPEEPPVKRIVEREGLVRGTFSIQAPTHFELISVDNGRTIDYLFTPSPNLDLRRYKGLHIIVTGEEGLEERWGNTPVLTIQKIQVLE